MSCTPDGCWNSVVPFLDERVVVTHNKPTYVNRNIFNGYSLPIWSSPVNNEEELLFRARIPIEWKEDVDPFFYAIVFTDTAQLVNKKFKFQLEISIADSDNIVQDTIDSTHTKEIDIGDLTSQYQAFLLEIPFYTPDFERCQHLAMRLRRVAASADEITGEIVLMHWDTRWFMCEPYKTLTEYTKNKICECLAVFT